MQHYGTGAHVDDSGVGCRAGKKMLGMLGSWPLPSTAFFVFIVLIGLVAFDIISIQINTRISVPRGATILTRCCRPESRHVLRTCTAAEIACNDCMYYCVPIEQL